jgi:poly-gamma-glutamate synthase PgsB/CapB
LKRASRLRVDALVSELMSIHPECLYTESVQMLAPHVLVLTNARVDHVAQMGRSPDDVARSLATAIPAHATVFLPEEELYPAFEVAARRMGSRLVPVPREPSEDSQEIHSLSFESNLRLALAVAEFCGIDSEIALRGMRRARRDFGALEVWTADLGSPSRRWYLVSAFAANDPESTRESLDKVRERMDLSGMRRVGLLNLRGDRGDRTLQWSQALECEPYSRLDRVYLLGAHARALRSKLPAGETRWSVLQAKEPGRIMEEIAQKEGAGSVLVGMGNMGGAGAELVRHWEKIGEAS